MLFEEQISRKPNLYPWTQDFINAMWTGFWTPNEFDFRADVNQFHTELSDHEREVVTRTLSAIGQVEIAVKRFWARLGENLPHPAMSDLGLAMANTEVIHNLAYEKLLDALRLQDVFERNLQAPEVKGRVAYLRKHLERAYEDDRKQYIHAIILFTLFVENVSLFSQFYVVLWFNRYRNVLKDTAQQVQYTRNEEAIHAQVGIRIINTLREEYPEMFDAELEARVRREAIAAAKAEGGLVRWMLHGYAAEKLDADLLENYIQTRLDQSLAAIGFAPAFSVEQDPATLWMDEETLGNNMTDFFHKRPVEYAKKARVFATEDLF